MFQYKLPLPLTITLVISTKQIILIRTEIPWFTTNDSFREIINGFYDRWLGILVGKFAGWHIHWNAIDLRNSSAHLISDVVYVERIRKKLIHLRWEWQWLWVRCPADIASVRFRSRLETSCESIHTEELW